MKNNRLLTVKETAKLLGISPKTIYNGLSKNAENPFPIKPKRVGRLVRFPLNRVEDFMEN